MSEVKAISPDDIKHELFQMKLEKAKMIPGIVIAAVNKLIVEKHSGSVSVVNIDEIIEKIHRIQAVRGEPTTERSEFFDKKWFDFEPLFEEAGWRVTFYKLPYYETAPDYFTFERR